MISANSHVAGWIGAEPLADHPRHAAVVDVGVGQQPASIPPRLTGGSSQLRSVKSRSWYMPQSTSSRAPPASSKCLEPVTCRLAPRNCSLTRCSPNKDRLDA